jgi:Raf kinase inhibitor-like YbhB/YbcL family protein
MKAIWLRSVCVFVLLNWFALSHGQTSAKKLPMIKITSSAFAESGMIPKKYTCDGADVNPPLAIEGVPDIAKSLVLIADDPDAPRGTWNHWLVWNIDPQTKEIKENSVPANAVQGTTDFGTAKYGGPCPPSGTHRYYFKMFALDKTLDLRSTAKRADLDKAMQGHMIAEGSLMGRYSRGSK